MADERSSRFGAIVASDSLKLNASAVLEPAQSKRVPSMSARSRESR